MKRISLLLLVSSLLVLAACNETKTSSSADSVKDGEDVYITRGITDDKILIGNIAPLTGPIAESGTQIHGIEAYFNYINENGGVHGRELELISYDDQYIPSQTVQVAPRLVEEDKVFLLMSTQGTANNHAVKDYYEENKVVSFLTNSGSPDFTATKNPYWLGTGLTVYNIEAEILLEYVINEIGAKKIAVVYQNDDFGNIGFQAVKDAIGNYEDAEIIAEIPYVSGNEDFSSQALKIKNSDPDAVLSFSLSGATASLKKSMYDIGIDVPFVVTGLGGNNTNQFELAGAEAWEGTISSAPYFNPTAASDDPQMEVYADQLTKDFPDLAIDGFAQAGWASAQVLVEILERAGEDLTMENFVESAYTLDDWEGSMYASVSFSKENHFGLTSLYITEAKDGKITPITGKITYDPETGEIIKE